jgi:hypothetical protein
MTIRFFLLLLIACLVQGCASSAKYEYNYKSGNATKGINLVDARDPKEKEFEILSLVVTDDKYAISRLADDQIVPDRMTYLKEQLALKGGDIFTNRKIEVRHFSIFNNLQAVNRHQAYTLGTSVGLGSAAGVLGGGIGGTGFNTTKASAVGITGVLASSVYSKATGFQPNAEIITEIEIIMDSKHYSTIAIAPYLVNASKTFSDTAAIAPAVKLSMDAAIFDLVAKAQVH